MVRTPLNCPFSPASDVVPDIWAGRVDEMADWRDRLLPRRLAGVHERGRTVMGEPGIGKSSLTANIARMAAKDGHIVVPTVRIPQTPGALALMADALARTADEIGMKAERTAASWLDRLRRVSVGAVGVDLDPAEALPLSRVLTRALVDIATLAHESERAVLVRIDECQNATQQELSQMLTALADALAHEIEVADAAGTVHQQALPLAVYLTALPEFQDVATSEAGATFGRRFAPVVLRSIDDEDLRAALADFVGPGWQVATEGGPALVSAAAGAIDALLGRVLGDPFLFQLLGQAAWEASTGPVIEVADVEAGWGASTAEARSHVSRMLERVPDGERRVLDAMASVPADERTAHKVAIAAGHDSSTRIGAAARRLEDVRGLIERRTGRYQFTSRTIEAYLKGEWP